MSLVVILLILLLPAFWSFTARIINPIPNNAPFPNNAKCIDSDGGTFSEIAGNVSVRKAMQWGLGNKKYNVYYDYCINSTTLLENYCDKSARKSVRIKCENGCKRGACINILGTIKKLAPVQEMYNYYPTAELKVIYTFNSSASDEVRNQVISECPDMNISKEYLAIGFFDSNSSDKENYLSFFWVDAHNISQIYCKIYGFYSYLSACKINQGELCDNKQFWCGNNSIILRDQDIRSRYFFTCCSGGCKSANDYNCSNIMNSLMYNGNPNHKVDIVLFSANYLNRTIWLEDAMNFSDIASSNHGLFYYEPIKSNKEAFNVWYADFIPEIKSSGFGAEGDFSLNEDAFKIVQLISRRCIGEYDVASIIVNNENTGVSVHGGNAGPELFSIERFTRNPEGNLVLNKVAFTHEFGHSFANLGDEYENGMSISDYSGRPNIDVEGCPKWCSGVLNTSAKCYAKYIKFKSCLYNLTENLTKPDAYYEQYNLLFPLSPCPYPSDAVDCNLGINCKTETGCYWNAKSLINFRSSKDSLMRHGKIDEFNLISRKAILNKTKEISGGSFNFY